MASVTPSTPASISSSITTNLKRIPYKAVPIAYIPVIAINHLMGTESTITLSLLVFGGIAGAFIGSKAHTNNLIDILSDPMNTLEWLKETAKISAVAGTILFGIVPLLLRYKLF